MSPLIAPTFTPSLTTEVPIKAVSVMVGLTLSLMLVTPLFPYLLVNYLFLLEEHSLVGHWWTYSQAIQGSNKTQQSLPDVLCVPRLKKNLNSVAKLCKTNHVSVEFFPTHFFVKDLRMGALLMRGRMKVTSTILLCKLCPRSTLLPKDHCLTFITHWVIPLSKPYRPNFKLSSFSNFHCDSCSVNKSHKLPFGSTSFTATKPLQLVYTDVWGPTQKSIDGFSYYTIFVDFYSKYVWFYPIKKKSDVVQLFPTFKRLVETYLQTHLYPFSLTTGESIKSMGVSHFTTPSAPAEPTSPLPTTEPESPSTTPPSQPTSSSYTAQHTPVPPSPHHLANQSPPTTPLSSSMIQSESPTPSPVPPVPRPRKRNPKYFNDKFINNTTRHPLLTTIEPTTYTQALKDPKWHKAMDDEFNASSLPPSIANPLVANGCFVSNAIPMDPLLNTKPASLPKAFTNSIVPVTKPVTIRTVLSIALSMNWPLRQLDVNNVFLQGTLHETVYMVQPSGYTHPQHPNHLCHLKKIHIWAQTSSTCLVLGVRIVCETVTRLPCPML
ncbi:hypothetical protein OSB04_028598 [Centaurea solstitialis]|uniref:Reverse transcriptase Ty1/copia-type domain-containing protein n=1 Tax=Centaurea solstitialis TaxID=347529 RepID=A0AA38VXW9_9ASTR|nr:hypothetical protein OSB04_028598 [Centaurea solstitialis]